KEEIIFMLGKRGDKAALPSIKELLQENDFAVRCAAISALVQIAGNDATEDLISFLNTDNKNDIAEAKSILMSWRDSEIMNSLSKALPALNATAQVVVLDIFSARLAYDKKAAIISQLENQSEYVRVAALNALGSIGDDENAQVLLDRLVNAASGKEKYAAQSAIVKIAKRGKNREKIAPLLISRMESSEGKNKVLLLRVIPQVGGKAAINAVQDLIENGGDEYRDAAIRALAGWTDEGACNSLLSIIKNKEEKLVYRVLALRGFVDLTDKSQIEPEKKFQMYKDVLEITDRKDDIKTILAGLKNVRTKNALDLVAPFLSDPDLQGEAALTVVNIACPANNKEKGLTDSETAGILKEALPHLSDDKYIKRTEKHIIAIAPEQRRSEKKIEPKEQVRNSAEIEKGFTSLFNGKDLTGWTGSAVKRKGYKVENGVLICDKGRGTFRTEKEYSDFVLHFEFKLTPGANNGLGIRTPAEGNAAYAGMELQILDNTAEKYSKLKPYQYHGSIYGVVPAKRGYLKPVGEWNAQEVSARGNQIKVVLNGETIVDADIAAASINGTMDGKEHPGLLCKTGYISFLSHASHVEFRNIRIKEIK
ncbi:family 16 glycoside hydrolase, partial [Verrucomicrobiota bacterium]